MHQAPLLERQRMHAFVGEGRRLRVTRRTPTRARSGAQKPRVGQVERRGGERCDCRGAPCAWRCGVVSRGSADLGCGVASRQQGRADGVGSNNASSECVSQQSTAPPTPARHALASKSGVKTLKIKNTPCIQPPCTPQIVPNAPPTPFSTQQVIAQGKERCLRTVTHCRVLDEEHPLSTPASSM